MQSRTLRQRFLDFFRQRGHAMIGAGSLIPEDDPSVLFTTAGMHPLVPFLLGEPHPAGRRVANVQPCLRTNDILEVGDDRHLTFFEMAGNWSFGDYWKADSIRWSYTFLTEELGFEPQRLAVTCFVGDHDAPRDEEAASIWRELGMTRIAFLPKEDNWWGPPGATGPCGPDSEIFFDLKPGGPADEHPGNAPARFCEIWNNVFMQYQRQNDGSYIPLMQRNVDTGLGIERVTTILQHVPTVFETDIFVPIMARVRSLSAQHNEHAERIVADHVRAACFVLAEGIRPGNTDQPYVLRRLLRRAVRYGRELGMHPGALAAVSEAVISSMADVYPVLVGQANAICGAIEEEEGRFQRTLQRGERFFQKAAQSAYAQNQQQITGPDAFHLYDTYGFPLELTEESALEQGLSVDRQGFQAAFEQHQQQSRQGAAARFRGGLAERSPQTTRLHTATHLLHAALREVLGPHVEQRGSNITAERLRFDFSHSARLTPEQIAAVQALVNGHIQANLPIEWQEMSLEEARIAGAIGLFGERYGERVKVYAIGDASREICGGPHVEHTSELGHFRITKEEAVGAGLRRIKAVLEE